MLQAYVRDTGTCITDLVNSKPIEGVHRDKKARIFFLITSLKAKGEFNKNQELLTL